MLKHAYFHTVVFAGALAFGLAACSNAAVNDGGESPRDVAAGEVQGPSSPDIEKLTDREDQALVSESSRISGLPYAGEVSFATLDEYLAYLRQGAAMDKPWYKEIEPGVYQLQRSGNFRQLEPTVENEPVTREELARRLGFTD